VARELRVAISVASGGQAFLVHGTLRACGLFDFSDNVLTFDDTLVGKRSKNRVGKSFAPISLIEVTTGATTLHSDIIVMPYMLNERMSKKFITRQTDYRRTTYRCVACEFSPKKAGRPTRANLD
jgi:hypothetical protein